MTTILDYNIWNYSGNWRHRRTLLLDVMSRTEPDVIALQEVRHTWHDLPGENQAIWLARRLGYQTIYRPANTFWPLPPVVEGLAFLPERPVDFSAAYRLDHVLGSGPRRIVLHTRVNEFDVYNVHFALSPAGRMRNARRLVDLVQSTAGGPAIILGDFNADPDEAPIRFLRGCGFIDLWTQLGGSEAPLTDPAGSPRRRLDYVFGTGRHDWQGSIDLVGSQPDSRGTYPSDHLGLLIRLA